MTATPGAISPRPRAEWRRRDAWWVEPLTVVIVLGSFALYSLWAALQNAYYYAAPYLSPFYSPCLAANCAHVTLPIIGSWWNLSPAFLILGIPLGFRATCYYYRKAYYRAFFWAPPACSIPPTASCSGRSGRRSSCRCPRLLWQSTQCCSNGSKAN